jgi:uracil-DNA glycosylase
MKERKSAVELIPPGANLTQLRVAATNCQACDLWKNATQTVFGEGARGANVMFVGEQPGNDEDLQGKPFVGPAGKLLEKVLQELGINRNVVYITNAVKHFKWVRRGKRRIHEKPGISEIAACQPWLEAEIKAVRPKIIVCLGATAAQVLLGREFRVTQKRGEFLKSSFAPFVMATVHPSSILRAPDEESRRAERARFVTDLKVILEVL